MCRVDVRFNELLGMFSTFLAPFVCDLVDKDNFLWRWNQRICAGFWLVRAFLQYIGVFLHKVLA
jgi:hypothetical protein